MSASSSALALLAGEPALSSDPERQTAAPGTGATASAAAA
jgi:hypothetical protein